MLDEASLTQAHKTVIQAIQKPDTKTLDQVLAKNFYVTGTGKKNIGRQLLLKELANGNFIYDEIVLSDHSPQVQGSTGTISVHSDRTLTYKGQKHQRSTQVHSFWSYDGGAWKLTKLDMGNPATS